MWFYLKVSCYTFMLVWNSVRYIRTIHLNEKFCYSMCINFFTSIGSFCKKSKVILILNDKKNLLISTCNREENEFMWINRQILPIIFEHKNTECFHWKENVLLKSKQKNNKYKVISNVRVFPKVHLTLSYQFKLMENMSKRST